MIIPTLQRKKLRFRKVRHPATGCRMGGKGARPGSQAVRLQSPRHLPISACQWADQTRANCCPSRLQVHLAKNTSRA